ncbi:MAG TPA: hypothetical protein EYP36_06295 [Calditrichaeota bacterium]|nr:hypothetical protein [Calditrichota bacterium]
MDLKTKKHYSIKWIDRELDNLLADRKWAEATIAQVNTYLWMDNGYTPRVEVRLLYSTGFIYVHFTAYEKAIVAKYTQINDPVYKDSCVEFFVNPFPANSGNYLNVEVNAIGTVRAEFGGKEERSVINSDVLANFEIATTLKKPIYGVYGSDYWQVAFKLPILLLEELYKQHFKGDNAVGNFYKCGDETKVEHYGMWSRIENPVPSFHLPEYFGIFSFLK